MTQRQRLSAGLRERRAQLIASEAAPARKWRSAGLVGAGLAGVLAVMTWPSSDPDIGDDSARPPAQAQTIAADTGTLPVAVGSEPEASLGAGPPQQHPEGTGDEDGVPMAVPLEVSPPPLVQPGHTGSSQDFGLPDLPPPRPDQVGQTGPAEQSGFFPYEAADLVLNPEPGPEQDDGSAQAGQSDFFPYDEQLMVLNPQVAPEQADGVAAVDTGWVEEAVATGPLEYEEVALPDREVDLPDVPEIDFTSQTAEEALAVVHSAPAQQRWMIAFFLGEQVGHHYGPDLSHAKWFSKELPESLRGVFYNGLAHTVLWDIEDPQA